MSKNRPVNSLSLPRRQHEVAIGWSWEAFLKPLKPLENKRSSSPVSDSEDSEDSEDSKDSEDSEDFEKSLVDRFTEQLAEDCKRKAKSNFVRADREKSGSKWTTEMLKRYIEHKDTAVVVPMDRCDLTGETLDEICRRVDLAIKAICGPTGETVENLDKLHLQPNSTEFNTRMILDAILQPLCVDKGLTLRSEKTIKSKDLPSCRFDYIVYWEVDRPIGVIEAKRQGCLKDNSVAQLIVKLLLLSSENPKWFYFGVLSDAHQFIFAGVSKQKVMFFQTKENQLEIATVKSDDDVRSIVGTISLLIDLAIKSRIASSKPIEDFFAPIAALQIKESFFEQ